MTIDAVVGAAYTLIGAVAGAFIAFVPMAFLSILSRIKDNNATANLLLLELNRIGSFSQKLIDTANPATHEFSGAPVGAWAYAETRPTFMTTIRPETFQMLDDAFSVTILLNRLCERASASGVQMGTSSSWGDQHQKTILELNEALLSTAADLQSKVTAAIDNPQFRQYCDALKVKICLLTVFIAVLAIVACVVVGFAVDALLPGQIFGPHVS